MEENLSKLGLSPSEIKVYLHLIKKGSSYANRISSETGINRTNVYEALDRLIAKGGKRKLLEYKFVDNKFTNPTTTIVYGDNCLLINWSDEPIAIKINNREIAKSHLNYFDMLWSS